METAEVRFWRFVPERQEGECWEWTGGKDADGYAHFRVSSSKQTKGARFAWELDHGMPVPSDMQVHHRCHNRGCVNPAHLEAISRKGNLLGRGLWKRTVGYVAELDRLSAGTEPATFELLPRHAWLVAREAERRALDPEVFLARALDSYFLKHRVQMELPHPDDE